MTNEEAIICLKGIKNYGRDTFTEQRDWQDSLDIAINALSNSDEDCISRKQLLAEIFDLPKSTNKNYWDGVDDVSSLVSKMPSIQPKAKWIPVSERLPEERGAYIVTEKVFSLDDREHKGRYNTMVEQVEYSNGKWQRASFFEVIAWMPLPNPYTAEKE